MGLIKPERMKLAVIAALLLSAGSSSAPAQNTSGPFGFNYGMTAPEVLKLVGKDAVKHYKNEADDTLTLSTAPKPHPGFEEYMLMISPERGLVKIYVLGKNIPANRYGEKLKDAFTEIQDAITETYGQPERAFDSLRSGSLWKEPEDWMMGLLKEERRLRSYWRLKTTINHITAIALGASADSTENGRLTVDYEFDGFTEYQKAKDAKTKTVF
jgi:hypothetical protein